MREAEGMWGNVITLQTVCQNGPTVGETFDSILFPFPRILHGLHGLKKFSMQPAEAPQLELHAESPRGTEHPLHLQSCKRRPRLST